MSLGSPQDPKTCLSEATLVEDPVYVQASPQVAVIEPESPKYQKRPPRAKNPLLNIKKGGLTKPLFMKSSQDFDDTTISNLLALNHSNEFRHIASMAA